MPIRDYLTGRERLIYDEGYDDGFRDASPSRQYLEPDERRRGTRRGQPRKTARRAYEKPRAGNRWNKYVAKKGNQIRYKSGADKGKLNLKAMGTKYRKKYKIKKGKK